MDPNFGFFFFSFHIFQKKSHEVQPPPFSFWPIDSLHRVIDKHPFPRCFVYPNTPQFSLSLERKHGLSFSLNSLLLVVSLQLRHSLRCFLHLHHLQSQAFRILQTDPQVPQILKASSFQGLRLFLCQPN